MHLLQAGPAAKLRSCPPYMLVDSRLFLDVNQDATSGCYMMLLVDVW